MAHPWITQLTRAVVLVRPIQGEPATGFLLIRHSDRASGTGAAFLITNRHVLDDEEQLTILRTWMPADGGDPALVEVRLPLRDGDQSLWASHANPDVDVVAINVTEAIHAGLRRYPGFTRMLAEEDFLAAPTLLVEQNISAGDDVLLIGFPLGLLEAGGAEPILRQGILASRPGQKVLEQSEDGERVYEVPGFRIDAGVAPGASGSPVVLKPTPTWFLGDGRVSLGPARLPVILGVAAKAYTAKPRDAEYKITTGLGLAFDFEAIRETIVDCWRLTVGS